VAGGVGDGGCRSVRGDLWAAGSRSERERRRPGRMMALSPATPLDPLFPACAQRWVLPSSTSGDARAHRRGNAFLRRRTRVLAGQLTRRDWREPRDSISSPHPGRLTNDVHAVFTALTCCSPRSFVCSALRTGSLQAPLEPLDMSSRVLPSVCLSDATDCHKHARSASRYPLVRQRAFP
jgi:hypothetical protein